MGKIINMGGIVLLIGGSFLIWFNYITFMGWSNPIMTLANFIITFSLMGIFGLIRDILEKRY